MHTCSFISHHTASTSSNPPVLFTAVLYVQLVRYVAQVTAETQPGPNGEARPFYDFLESCLRHKTEMVIFEAARAICDLKVCFYGRSFVALVLVS